MMHGKIMKKLLPLAVSASLVMGTAASVMAEDLDVTASSQDTSVDPDEEDPSGEEKPSEESVVPYAFPDEEQESETTLSDPSKDTSLDPVSPSPVQEELPDEIPQEPPKYKVRLKDAYAHVRVLVSDKKQDLPHSYENVQDTSAVSEAFSDESLILVTVDNDNADHLVTEKELEKMVSTPSEEEGTSLVTANNGVTELEFTEGTAVYISAAAEEDYKVSNIFLTTDDGMDNDISDEEEKDLYSFVMPAKDVSIDVLTEEIQTLVPTDFTETEIMALEDYMEEQGITLSRSAMLMAAAASSVKTITFNMNGFISYSAEGYGSGYDAMFYIAASNYQGNGNGYCLNPAVQAPGSDRKGQQISYTTTVTDYTDPMLLKIMYYGFGGPKDITGAHVSTPTAAHILTHMVAVRRSSELGIPGSGDYTYKANATAIAKANTLYNAIAAMPDILGTVSILTPVAGQQTIMLLSSYSLPDTRGRLEVKKVSAKSDLSSGNPNYTLEGAKYDVYADQALTSFVGSFTISSTGESINVMPLSPGTYYVKETAAPKGYLLDTSVHAATVSTGQTTTLTVSDMPANDPLTLLLEKKDAVTGKSDSRLKGAEFTVKFYPVENKADISTPKWTWVFATDENGKIRVDDAHKVSGDAIPKDAATGASMIPLGFLTIQETKAPSGYFINEEVITCQIMQDANVVRVTNLPVGENAVKEMPAGTDLSVKKIVTGSGGNKNQTFHFELSLANTADSSVVPSHLEYLIREEGKEDSKNTVNANNGKYSFTLQHGQTIVFKDIPVGIDYKVSEIDGESRGYTVTYSNEEGKTAAGMPTVVVTNNKEMTIPTGADSNRNVLLLIMAGCAVILLITGYRKIKINQ